MESSVFSHFSGFRYRSITFGITVSHPVIRVQSFLKRFIDFRWLFRLFHFGTIIISFGATRCLFSLLTSDMIKQFWSYPLAKRGW